MPKSLLIIDDSLSIHRLIQPLAEWENGLTLHFAYDGESGVEQAAHSPGNGTDSASS